MVAERDVFGFDHAEVGFLVVESWQLPLAIGEAVRYHHDTGRAVIDPSLCALIGLANGICIKLEIGPEKQPDLDLEAISTNSVLRLSGEYLCEVTARAQRSLAESESLFEMG